MGKYVILTGASGFMGKIIKKSLEGDGYIVIPYRNESEENISKNDVAISQIKFDSLKRATLIHCARSHKNITGVIDEEKWMDEYRQDVYYPYLTTRHLAKNGLIDNVIYISSIYGQEPPKVRHIPENYVAAKSAEIHLAKYLSIQLAPTIRVNTICYGGVLSDREAANQTPDFRKKYNQRVPLGHMVFPEEIYGPIKFLVENSQGMTGSVINVDGGYTVWLS